MKRNIRTFLYFPVATLIFSIGTVAAGADALSLDEESNLYEGTRLYLGVGLGIVRFDTKSKVTDKASGKSLFLDLEGNLDLPGISHVTTFYGAYRFNPKHSILFSYFAINRQSHLVNFSKQLIEDDVTVIVNADVYVQDKTRFYNVNYGYSLFRDNRSEITFVAGLHTLDLRLIVDAKGEVIVNGFTRTEYKLTEADVLAPLPLLGLNFAFSFTPEWSLATKVSLVHGSSRGVGATITQTSVNSMYRATKHVGIIMGISYFSASASIDDADQLTEIEYGYNGAYLGAHFIF